MQARAHRRAALAMAVAAFVSGQTSVAVRLTPKDVVSARIHTALMKNAERAEKLRNMFAAAGCPPERLQQQEVKHSKTPNLICTVPGQTDSEIIVGAHFDHVREGLGVIDNWSGASMLPSLLESILVVPRRHTFVFIAFTDEEQGDIGSSWYVKHLSSDDLRRISAMINIDSVGLGQTEVDTGSADKILLTRLLEVTGSMKLPVKFVNIGNVGTSDFAPFVARKVPTLTLHSITTETLEHVLHSKRDSYQALNIDAYYDSYRVAAVYLSYLDLTLN